MKILPGERIIVKNPVAEQKVATFLGDILPGCYLKVDTKNELYYRGYD